MGQPKAWLPFGDELMLQRVVRLLREVVDPVVVVAGPDQDVPPLPPEVSVVRDAERGRGPLQGLVEGLLALRERAQAVYLTSCDVPFLQPLFVRRLFDLLDDHSIVVPHVGGFHHPLSAVYRVEIVTVARELLAKDRLRPVFLYEKVPTRIVTAEALADVDVTFQTLRNLNTRAEYEAALRDLAGTSG